MMTLLRNLYACLTGKRAVKYNLAVRHLQAINWTAPRRVLSARNW